MKAMMIGAAALGVLLGVVPPAAADDRSVIESCNSLHSDPAAREWCYRNSGPGGRGVGAGSSAAPSTPPLRRDVRERDRAMDECAARYARGSRDRERCFDGVERRFGR